MSKIRINDLARELEVKSKAILDVLVEAGVTEKKTHSSSLEDHEAEKVRAHFRASGEAHSAGKAARASRVDTDGIKTKIDLSHISKPGDVLKAIISKQQAAPSSQPVPPARPATPPVAQEAKPPATPIAKPTSAAPAVPASSAPPRTIAPPAPSSPAQSRPVVPTTPPATAPPVAAVPPALAPPAARVHSVPPISAQVSPPRPAAPAPPPRPQPPGPRMIVPQTGPRPVYKAPPRPTSPAPGAPMRSAPGRPVPGQPIFQRARPAAPGARPPLRPGERRPMHPTRQGPAGARPMGVGPGLPPPGSTRPGSRPGGPARRPGQRYVPRGVKEGPMKGFVPPPRLSLSNEPMPITRSITIAEGISVKDLAEKLEIRAKDLIARLLAKGVFATINQTLDAELAAEMARFFGAETSVITFEEQAAKEVAETAKTEEGAVEEKLEESRSISALTRSRCRTKTRLHMAVKSCFWIRRVTRPLLACVREEQRRQISWSWWLRLTMA